MGRPATGLVVVLALSSPLLAQEHNRSLERISLALQQPPPVLSATDHWQSLRTSNVETLGAPIFEPLPGAIKLGPFTLGTARLRGEIIRVSLPIGEYVLRVAHGLAAANRRRQEAAARREVEAALKAFAEQQLPHQQTQKH